jgi:hypothetical protein
MLKDEEIRSSYVLPPKNRKKTDAANADLA